MSRGFQQPVTSASDALQQQQKKETWQTWKLKKIPIQWSLGQERNKEIKDFLEFNENEGTAYLNVWDTMKAVLRGNFKLSIKCPHKEIRGRVWWHRPKIPAPRRLKQENHESQNSLGYATRTYLEMTRVRGEGACVSRCVQAYACLSDCRTCLLNMFKCGWTVLYRRQHDGKWPRTGWRLGRGPNASDKRHEAEDRAQPWSL